LQAIDGERWIPGTGGPGFVEGNAYHYQFMLPHQMPELISLHGGEQNFKKNLSAVFDQNQFVLWNEPDMFYPYLFSYTGDLERVQSLIAELREKYFFNGKGGLPGNDDTGALSSWYVFSAMGFYPLNPVSGEYRLGLPLFEKIVIELDEDFYSGTPLFVESNR
jgi:putative alpha-1,2-mannosidase